MINGLAVLVCALAAILIGSFWYSPAGFGNAWMKEIGIKPSDVAEMKKKGMTGMWKSYVVQIAASLLTAYALAHFAKYTGANDPAGGAELGLWVWLGFVATTSTAFVTWEGKSWKWWVITNGCNLVTLVVMGGILATWK